MDLRGVMPTHKDNGHIHGLVMDSTDEDILVLNQNLKNIPVPNSVDTHQEVLNGIRTFFNSNLAGFNLFKISDKMLHQITAISTEPMQPRMPT